nr:SulP family inorganic anion transporter [Acaryochloris sp. CCMEE 5410]
MQIGESVEDTPSLPNLSTTMLSRKSSAVYLTLAMMLALLVGILQVLMGVVRLGFLVNFSVMP